MDIVPESNLEARLLIKRLTGLAVRVTPYEIVTRIVQKDTDQLVVQMRVYQAEERRTEIIMKGRGLRLTQYKLVNGTWRQLGYPVTAWETDYQPEYYAKFGPGKTVEEWYRARQFESECHRPGTDSHPLDSYQRTVVDGPDYTTRRMERHWA